MTSSRVGTTGVRHSGRGKWHVARPAMGSIVHARCGQRIRRDDVEALPADEIAPVDRCRNCFPGTASREDD